MKHSRLIASVIAATLFGGASYAQETFRVADSFPPGHYVIENGTQPWMDKIKENLGDAVEFQYFPAQQLGKAVDMLQLVTTGAVDIAYVGPAYVAEKMPLSEVVALPGQFTSSCKGTHAFLKLASDGPIAEHDIKDNGLKVLFGVALNPYQVFTTGAEIDGPESLAGVKLRSGNTPMDIALSSMNAVPVRVPGPDIYEAMTRGTIDGGILPYNSLLSYDLQKVLKKGTSGGAFGSFMILYVMKQDRWDGLSDEMKAAFTETSDAITGQLCAYVDSSDAVDRKKIEDAGVEIKDLSPEEAKAFSDAMKPAADDWAAALEKRGLPGNEVLKAFAEALETE